MAKASKSVTHRSGPVRVVSNTRDNHASRTMGANDGGTRMQGPVRTGARATYGTHDQKRATNTAAATTARGVRSDTIKNTKSL